MIDEYKPPDNKVPFFSFPLRDRFIQEGVGVKLITSVDAKPPPKVLRMYTLYYHLICSYAIMSNLEALPS